MIWPLWKILLPSSLPASLGLSFWQPAALALDAVVSHLPEKASVRLWLACQFSLVVFLGTAVNIRRLLFMPLFSINCKNCICFPLHTNIFLFYFHPSSSIAALVRQWEHVSISLRFLSWDLFLQDFMCGCCNAVKDARLVWICAVFVGCSKARACAQPLS